MLLLNAPMTDAQPDFVALGMILALLLVVAIMAIRKSILLRRISSPSVDEKPVVAPTSTAVAPGTAGELKLHDVAPKTAAMLMAIVADKAGKPLNELRFISIKEVK